MKNHRIVTVIALVLALAASLRAEVVQFTSATDKSLLAFWTVWIDGKEKGITDAQGRFRITEPTGEIEVTLKHPGSPDRTVKITIAGKQGLVTADVP